MTSCGNPNVESDAVMLKKPKFDGQTKICVRCKEVRGNVVVRYAVYCKSCFLGLVQGRFKKALEPLINPKPDGPRRKALKAAGSLLIGYSGGTGSTALLDLVAKSYFTLPDNGQTQDEPEAFKGGRDHPRNKDQTIWRGRPVVCYVEVCGAFVEEADRTEDIRRVVESYPSRPFDFVPLKLESAFDLNWWAQIGGDVPSFIRDYELDIRTEALHLASTSPQASSTSPAPLDVMRHYLSSLPTQTARHSSTQTLVRLLLLHTAASRQCSHLLLGTSLTTLSINLISGIAQGAGFSVAEEAKEEWAPSPEKGIPLRIVRPLRDIGMKECAMWAWWHELQIVGGVNHLSGYRKTSIASLTRDFIINLETDYPATVTTIAKTCAKLAPKDASDGPCILCQRPAQSSVQEWKGSISIRDYREASFAVLGNTRPPHLTNEEIEALTLGRETSSQDNSLSLTPFLCYACHTTLTSRSSRSGALSTSMKEGHIPLPMWVQASLEKTIPRNTTREDMMKQLEDYLLPDN